jgi:hypothetical protein
VVATTEHDEAIIHADIGKSPCQLVRHRVDTAFARPRDDEENTQRDSSHSPAPL